MIFHSSRAAGLDALAAFVPAAGRRYADTRNFDRGPESRDNVSELSPYLRYRLITEVEVVAAVRREHSAAASEKFLQEVLWRTYWKGWLELRPAVWHRYRTELAGLQGHIGAGRVAYEQAVAGHSGIDCFDAWVRELADYGYLHNHARMWFASIWIFTLRLPWQLGADLFYRQLYDGDPASNTLSWRWVAGLQTAGKTYLATADNISRYTDGRFAPVGLAKTATALSEPTTSPHDLPITDPIPTGRAGLLLVEDDLNPESVMLGAATVVAVASSVHSATRAPHVEAFIGRALEDARERAVAHFRISGEALPALTTEAVREWAHRHDLNTVVVAFAPIGDTRAVLDRIKASLGIEGIVITTVRRTWDSAAWPAARRGFFAFRETVAHLVA